DAVVQCASSRGGGAEDYRRIYLESAAHLAAVFPQARLLFTSSTSVYAQTEGEWVDELSPAAPLRPTGQILRETEELILARGGIVARLAGIYGPGRSASLRKLLAGDAVLGPDSDRYLNQVHRDDIAAALLLLIESSLESSSPRIFNVSDNHPLSQRACYEWLATELHRPLPPSSDVPAPRKRGASNKRIRSEKLLALGWAPRYPTFASGMRESVLPALAAPSS
ncbi:MAG: hypothetical protein ABI883_02540, partial [Chthoniobacterales bacterium]